MMKPYCGVGAPPQPMFCVVLGAFALAVRSKAVLFHVTRKFENDWTVESYVNDPDTGAGPPRVVVKLIVYVVTVSAFAGRAARAINPNEANARTHFVVFTGSPPK